MRTIILILLISFNSYSHIIPENNLSIPVSQKSKGMTESKFYKLIDLVADSYKDILIKEYGAKDFIVHKDWKSDKVNAATRKKDGNFELIAYGGLARFDLLSNDAFLIVLCHEIGHLMGGAPTYKPFDDASSEGQADYFSTSKCFKKIMKGKEHNIKRDLIPEFVSSKCDKVYSRGEDRLICYRSYLAQESMARVIESLSGAESLSLNVLTPDPYERMFTVFNGYPKPQCRVDTLFSGSLCNTDINELNDMVLYNKGNCNIFEGHSIGLRPKCWYVPRKD